MSFLRALAAPSSAQPDLPALTPGTPVVRRASGVVQVGFTVALTGAPPGAEQALRRLDGATPPAVAAKVARVDLTWMEHAIAHLGQAGLLETTAALTIGLHGTGAIAAQLSATLPSAGTVRPWTPGEPSPDVVVVASDAVGPDRVVTDGLSRRGSAHLVVCAAPGGAAVGPFVWPGSSPCQRCCDLTLSSRDRAWPVVAPQFAAAAAAPDAAAVAWAAGLAAAHVAVHGRGAEPESLGRTWELTRGGLHVRDWPRRPDCPCALDAA